MAHLSLAGLALILLAACGEKGSAPKSARPAASGKTGKVVETVNAAGYTYVQVDTGTEKFWAAGPEVKVQAGDTVTVPEGMPMPNYESKTLTRKFDLVYFVSSLQVNGAAPAGSAGAMPEGHPPAGGMPGMPASTGTPKVTAPADIDLKGIPKADQTVADLFAQKGALAGKPVKVRGKVVKFNSGIMGKNWLHIQDGSGQAGTNDLTVNTGSAAKVGDTVVVSGTLTVGKDFGFGYQYELLIEDAQIAKE
jgi:ribosomal protein S17